MSTKLGPLSSAMVNSLPCIVYYYKKNLNLIYNLQYMGNSEENIIAIDPFFYQVCHRKLSFGKINDKLKTIEINIPYN